MTALRSDTRPLPRAPQARSRLGTRLALILLPLVLVPLALMGGAAYLRARDILENQAKAQLVSLTQAQLEIMRAWARVREQQLQLGSQRTQVREALNQMMESSPGSAAAARAQTDLRTNLAELLRRGEETVFSEMMFVHLPDGTVVASTSPELEGTVLPAVRDAVVATDRLQTYPLFNDALLAPGNLALITSTPVITPGVSEPAGLLLGVNRGLRLGQLMEEMQVLWESQGIYRVERGDGFLALEPNVRIYMERYATAPLAQAGFDHPVYALARQTPSGSYEHQEPDPPVDEVGAYQWAPEWDMGVVLEIPAADIFSELVSLAPFTIGLTVVAALLSFGIVLLASGRLLRPLGDLTVVAERISQGEWDVRVPETRDDEIGALSAAFNRMSRELRGMYTSLEARVEERTRQVRTAAEVARAVTSTPNLNELLRRAVELIRDRFGYYHVTIFLLDESGKHAVVQESTGEVGQLLKARGHALEVGSTSIIGWVTANLQGRIATDVGKDPVHLKNELLPETRSEAAVPLQVAGRILGALDVQSTEPNAFGPDDLEILQTLADQLSAAIQNARLALESSIAAERARLLSTVTGKFSGLMDVERVLETAAQTLYDVLGQPEITVSIAAGSEPGDQADNGRE